MTVMETNIIDAMGLMPKTNELSLMISDHLDWELEPEHLLFLQEKINTYIGFIQEKQYVEFYPGREFDSYVIEIFFMYEISDTCIDFLDYVADQIRFLHIRITTETAR